MDEGCNRERFPWSGARRVSNSYLRARWPDYGAGRQTIRELRVLYQLSNRSAARLTPDPLELPTRFRFRHRVGTGSFSPPCEAGARFSRGPAYSLSKPHKKVSSENNGYG